MRRTRCHHPMGCSYLLWEATLAGADDRPGAGPTEAEHCAVISMPKFVTCSRTQRATNAQMVGRRMASCELHTMSRMSQCHATLASFQCATHGIRIRREQRRRRQIGKFQLKIREPTHRTHVEVRASAVRSAVPTRVRGARQFAVHVRV
jgi:hypothetical protein